MFKIGDKIVMNNTTPRYSVYDGLSSNQVYIVSGVKEYFDEYYSIDLLNYPKTIYDPQIFTSLSEYRKLKLIQIQYNNHDE